MRFTCRLCVFCAVLCPSLLTAEVKLPKVYADHMVLQRDKELTVWGWSDPGERVELTTPSGKQVVIANDKGEWKATIQPLKAGGPHELTIKGENEIVLHDVLVGDVWICSGQSNMEMRVASVNDATEEIANANFPNIRLFHVKKVPQNEPNNDVELTSSWQPCTPQSVPGFSAVGYFFGRKLNQELKIPIGLINTSWGGTRIEPWTPPEGFAQVESVKTIPGNVKPDSQANRGTPMHLYNGMVHGLVPFGIKGAIWYQGEANRKDGMLYRDKMEALIAGWRTVFGQGDFPFYFVQIAPYQYGQEEPHILPELWEAQEAVLSIPNTGMAVTTDVANLKDIHPKNKQAVGLRLALWALANTYDQQVVYSGPVYKSMKVEGNSVRLSFEHSEGLKSIDGEDLSWFTIAGADGMFVEAKAVIDGDSIVVSNETITEPKAVRFGWDKLAEPNLVNGAGLPASPFRTDKH